MLENCSSTFNGRIPDKRPPSGEHFVEHRTEGKQIRPRVRFLPTNLLGGHVGKRSENQSLSGKRLIQVGGWLGVTAGSGSVL